MIKLLRNKMPAALRIRIKYSGREVDDGTMPLGDVLEALHGFSGAYGKIASNLDPERQHQLRLSAIEHGSFELAIIAWAILSQASGPLSSIQIITDSARWVVSKITGIIAAKKHTKGNPYSFNLRGDNNTVVVINAEGAEMAFPPETFELFESKLIDSDLNKIAAPLHPGRVDNAEIRTVEDAEVMEANITSEEREYFRPPESVITTKETEIIGKLVSLNQCCPIKSRTGSIGYGARRPGTHR
jgi:hypothetical protein